MNIQLTANEVRVIGCLIEKSLTTPDQYPLSINSLTNACNQKSNRDPVVAYSEIEVQSVVDQLMEKRLIIRQAGVTSRVEKYQHRFCNTEFGDLRLSAQQLGIICVLFLRGPQTPGELRSRTNRLCDFTNVAEVESTLESMIETDSAPYVVKLAREPGRRESRYDHCFSFPEKDAEQQALPDEVSSLELPGNEQLTVASNKRLETLEEQVELMQMEIDELREQLSQLLN